VNLQETDKLNLRFIEEADLKAVADMERLANRVKDNPEWVQPWTMGVPGILDIIRQRRDELRGTYDTRTMVVERPVPVESNPNQYAVQVCGAFSYELQPAGYELLYTVLHPDAKAECVLQIIAYYLRGKADRSPVRRKVIHYVRDRDEAGLRTLLPFWKSRGFAVHLVRDHFENNIDGWRLTYESEVPNDERDKHDQDKERQSQ